MKISKAVLAVLVSATVAALVLAFIALGNRSESKSPDTQQSEMNSDPYEVYKAVADQHPDWVELSREDAQTRAILGCGFSWAPNTQDAALQEAYAHLCDPNSSERTVLSPGS